MCSTDELPAETMKSIDPVTELSWCYNGMVKYILLFSAIQAVAEKFMHHLLIIMWEPRPDNWNNIIRKQENKVKFKKYCYSLSRRGSVCVCDRERERERECVCVCVCVCTRACVCTRKHAGMYKCVSMHVSMCAPVCFYVKLSFWSKYIKKNIFSCSIYPKIPNVY